MKKVCFTGHRDTEHTPELKEALLVTCEELIHRGATDFYAGGARGFDILAECAVIMLKNDYTQIRLHLILPCSEEEQTRGWDFLDRALYRYAAGYADTKEVCGGFGERNQRLVDNADICVCRFNPKNVRSGTAQTVRMAREKGIEIVNLFRI